MTVQEALTLALTHHHAGRYAEAGMLCRKILEVCPGHPDALLLLGVGAVRMGDCATGLDAIAQLLAPAAASATATANAVQEILVCASGHFQAGRLPEARALCLWTLALVPANGPALQLLALIEKLSHDAESGLRLIVRARSLEPANPNIGDSLDRIAVDAANLAIAHYNAGRTARATALFARVALAAPAHEGVHRALARVQRALGDHDAAVRTLRRVAVINPAPAGAFFELGASLGELSRWTAAAAAFHRLLVLDPAHPAADFRQRIAHHEAGKAQTSAGEAADQLWSLRHDYYLNWPPSPALVRHAMPVPAPPVPTQDYDAYYRGERLPHRRRIHPVNPSSCFLIEQPNAELAYIPYYTQGAFGWLTTVARCGELSSNGGTPPEMINRLFTKVLHHGASNRLMTDLKDCRVVEHPNEEPVVFMENFMNYGHWLIDHLPRLQFLEPGGILDRCTVFCPAVTPWQSLSLSALGLASRTITTDRTQPREERVELHRFKNLWFCGAPPIHARVAYLREKLLPAAQGRFDFDRIFITRRKRISTRIENEPEVIQFLESHGFHTIAPEDFSFLEQVALFSTAKIVISTTGSAYANVVFCPAGTTYIELTSWSMFEEVKESFDHYDMFSALGVRHIPLLHDSFGPPGVVSFPNDDGFAVDLDQLGTVLRTL